MKEEMLSQLMERLEDGRPDPDQADETWLQSERAYFERRRAANLQAWRDFHLGQAERIETMAASLAQEHRRRASELGKGA